MTEPRFLVGATTHVGRVRNSNEDSYVVTDNVFAVADGMGGHLAGEVASAMTVTVLRYLEADVSTDDAVQAVISANAAILQRSRSDAAHRGMGTTLTGLVVVQQDNEQRLAVINVGDSRTYRLRSGALEQVTIDHSYVQELVAAGHITAEEARSHPQRNIVTRALGIEAAVGIDVWTLPVVRGDRYLACSDGLVDEVTDEVILDVLCEYADPQAAADELVRRANAAGGRDNTTVVVVDVAVGLDPATVNDADGLRDYITVRGTDPERNASDDTLDTTADSELSPIDELEYDEVNPPADLTNAVVSGGTYDDGSDDTPSTAARRRLLRERANTRMIVIGAAIAAVAVLLVILTAVLSGDDKSSPRPTVTFTEDTTLPGDPNSTDSGDTITGSTGTGPDSSPTEN